MLGIFNLIRGCILMCTLLFSLDLRAQERTVNGQVTDEAHDPIPGVNVLVKGATQGTITDVDSNHKLNVPGTALALVFSFVGYEIHRR